MPQKNYSKNDHFFQNFLKLKKLLKLVNFTFFDNFCFFSTVFIKKLPNTFFFFQNSQKIQKVVAKVGR